MLIGSGTNNLNRYVVGLILASLMLSSIGPLSPVSANSTSTPATNSTSTVIDNSSTQNSSSTQSQNTSTTTQTSQVQNTSSTPQNGSSTPVVSSSTPETSNTSSTEESEPLDQTIIDTGDAGAFADNLNVVNTNIIDSRTFFAFMNYLNGIEGDITVPWSEEGQSRCNDNCLGTDIDIENNNGADVVNDITVIANTGENSITSNNGTSTIVTGNAAAAANVGNVVNTNIVNSNYLLLALNSFNSFNGNLVLPPATFFTDQHAGITTPQTHIENNNGADVQNNVSTTAKTGDNEITGEGDGGLIATGNANAFANVYNDVNRNLVNTNKMFILVRVAGDWGGDVFSAPPGMSWAQTPQGIMLFSDGSGEASECATCEGSTTIENNNGASVTNNIDVYALTGDNKIETTGDDESQEAIVTGHAAAAANVYNMVNSNVIGTNYLFAMINIFGDWNGNLAFGQPDLWVGARAEMTGDPLAPGDYITYHIDVVNRGNTDATQVQVKSHSPQNRFFNPMNFSTGGGVQGDGSIMWILPRIPAGGRASFSYQTEVGDGLPSGLTLATNEISVDAYEPESDENNNVESISLAMMGNTVSVGRPGGSGNGTPRLLLEKTSDAADQTIAPSSTVRYTLNVKNVGSAAAFDSMVIDTLRNPYGQVITRNGWDLGIVYPGETIEINYDIFFSQAARTGHYINYAYVTATDDYYMTVKNLPRASSSIYIVNPDDTPPPPPPVVQVGGGPSQGTPDENTEEGDEESSEENNEETSGGGGVTTPEEPTSPEPPQPPSGASEDDLFDSAGEPVLEGSGVEIIESFEPIREIDENHESLIQATTSFIRSKLLASFAFLPSGAWAFFLLLLLLIAVVSRSLLEESK